MFSDPQVLAREMVVEMNHEKLGKVRQIGMAIKLSDTPGTIRSLGGLLGQDTDEVLSGAGYAQSDINSLRQEGVIY